MNNANTLCSKCNERPVKKVGKLADGSQRYSNICARCSYHLYGNGSERTHLVRDRATPEPEFCECCGDKKPLVLDHCHILMKFRGWLCHHCNVGLGFFKHDISRLEKAEKYLNEFNHTLNNTTCT